MTDVVLASGSPRRTQLLHQIGIAHHVCTADVDESIAPGLQPGEAVTALALKKASHVLSQGVSGFVIGADTVVVLDGQILGKPRDESEAKQMLTLLQGRDHRVYTGVAVISAASGEHLAAYREVRVRMRDLTSSEIAMYVASGEPMDKAGAYSIQGLGGALIEDIEGDFYAVVGLPLTLTIKLLGELGYRYAFHRRFEVARG